MADTNFTRSTKTPRKTKANTKIDKILATMNAKGPMLSCEDMDKIEARWEEERRARRCSLVLMTKPFSWLKQQVKDDRDFALAVADVFRCTNENQFYKGVNELMEQAHLWAMIALCEREDMQEILAEVEA